MNKGRLISYNTLLLVMTAGFCDTTTFISVNKLFSAHVTGNFIVFVYDVINRVDLLTWVRLVTFPVFFLAILAGGWAAGKVKSRLGLLRMEGLLLVLVGLVSLGMRSFQVVSLDVDFMIALLVVFAMGVQNTFGRLYSKETHGTTTTMTGNVTQMGLNLLAFVSRNKRTEEVKANLRHDALTVGGFLCGCFAGGMVAHFIGLTGILIPGIALLLWAGGRFLA
ncbi:MAG TPA: YoaK family protein [Puia sp.]